MAGNFLLASKMYRENMPIEIQLRQHFVCRYLPDTYTLPRGKAGEAAIGTNQLLGINIKLSTYRIDIRTIYKAWEYLSANSERKQEIVEDMRGRQPSASSDNFGIWCLLQDDITTHIELDWEVVKQETQLLDHEIFLLHEREESMQEEAKDIEVLLNSMRAIFEEKFIPLHLELERLREENKRLRNRLRRRKKS